MFQISKALNLDVSNDLQLCAALHNSHREAADNAVTEQLKRKNKIL